MANFSFLKKVDPFWTHHELDFPILRLFIEVQSHQALNPNLMIHLSCRRYMLYRLAREIVDDFGHILPHVPVILKAEAVMPSAPLEAHLIHLIYLC